jgi:hypothetical protein
MHQGCSKAVIPSATLSGGGRAAGRRRSGLRRRLGPAPGGRTPAGSCPPWCAPGRRTPPRAGRARCVADQLVHEGTGLLGAPAAGVLLHEPEGAGEEGVLAGFESVVGLLGAVAQQQPRARSAAAPRGRRPFPASAVVIVDEPHLGSLQQRGIQLRLAVRPG